MYRKYRAVKTVVDGIKFDSKKEANRYLQLKEMENNGEITNLQLQIPFEILPKQFDIHGKVKHRAINYIADFVYDKDGKNIVEDSKGLRTPEYKIKKKLLYYFKGIDILET